MTFPTLLSYILLSLSLLPFIIPNPFSLNTPLPLSLSHLNTTTPFPPSTPPKITCHTPTAPASSAQPTLFPISISTCRPVLNWIRTLPSYRLVQRWEAGDAPRLPIPGGPATPPFGWHKQGSACTVRVDIGELVQLSVGEVGEGELAQNAGKGVSGGMRVGIRDRFSFEQVRALATDVLQECEGVGYGGWAAIGDAATATGARNGWVVDVRGAAIESG